MTQANDVLELELLSNASADLPESDLDFLIGDGDDEQEDVLDEGSSEEDDSKPGKGRTTRRRTQAKKKHYTEDSIRLYLQEIGLIL
jgi:RNA polymerase primary sigma factor